MPDERLIRERLRLDPRAFAGDANTNRTPGIHLTDVLRDCELVMNGGVSKYAGNGWSEDMLDDAAIQGFLWEEAMTETLRNRVRKSNGEALGAVDYVRLPEIALHKSGQRAFFVDPKLDAETLRRMTRGHLLLTPDGMRATQPAKLIECKWTLQSATMDPTIKRKQWFHQAKAYLLALSIVLQQPIFEVEWHVHFSRGEYEGGKPPIYERWSRLFEPQEIMNTWQMVLGQIDYRLNGRPEQGGGTDPHGWRAYWEGEAA